MLCWCVNAVIDFVTYLKCEEETTKVTMQKRKKEHELYRSIFNLCSETTDYLCSRTKAKLFSVGKEVTLFLLPRIMQSLQSIRILTLKGYYCDASILARSLFESLGLGVYLSSNDEEAVNWLRGKKLKVTTIDLFEYVAKSLPSRSIEDIRRVYGRTCDYVHSNVQAIQSLIDLDETPQRAQLKFCPTFDEDEGCYFASYAMAVALVINEIFRNELPEERRARIGKLSTTFARERARVSD